MYKVFKIIVWILFIPTILTAIANLFSGVMELFIGSVITLAISGGILGAMHEND